MTMTSSEEDGGGGGGGGDGGGGGHLFFKACGGHLFFKGQLFFKAEPVMKEVKEEGGKGQR